MKTIAHIYTDFPTKFGIPRQSGLISDLKGKIIMEPEYRNPDAFKGLEKFSHIWLIWKFSESKKENWSATVKPPRLEGRKMGVFATRSPFRPNDIGLSSVKLEKIVTGNEGPVLYVAGIDLMDNTPIYDIKPYIAFTDSHPDALEGFTSMTQLHELQVYFPEKLQKLLPVEKQKAAIEMLKQDPRPSYDRYEDRIYGVLFAGFDIRFTVQETYLEVCEIIAKN